MSIVSFIIGRRRVLLLCAATVLLHVLMINWVGARVGSASAEQAPPAPATIVALLRAPADEAAPAPPAAHAALPPTAAAAAPRRARHRRSVRAAAAPAPAAAAASAPASAAEAAVQADLTVPASADGAAAAALAQPEPAGDTAAAAGAGPAQPAPAAAADQQSAPARHYLTSVPPAAVLKLDVVRTDADGTRWSGSGSMRWRRTDGGYAMQVDIGISLLVARVNLVQLSSEGAIDDYGIAPLTATEKRRGKAQTATHFNRADGRITFSASERSDPLPPGAQDKATLPMQLAAIARGGVAQLGDQIDITVGEEREATLFRFVVAGQEEIDTPLGRLQTWHLQRPPVPGAYNSQLDIWLAPEREWYPVRISNTEKSGAVTTQTVTRIDLAEQ